MRHCSNGGGGCRRSLWRSATRRSFTARSVVSSGARARRARGPSIGFVSVLRPRQRRGCRRPSITHRRVPCYLERKIASARSPTDPGGSNLRSSQLYNGLGHVALSSRGTCRLVLRRLPIHDDHLRRCRRYEQTRFTCLSTDPGHPIEFSSKLNPN